MGRIMKLSEIYKNLLIEGIPNSIVNRIKVINDLIDDSLKNYWTAIEPDGTWEERYEFEKIKYNDKMVYITYTEPYNRNKKYSDKYGINHEDLLPTLSWVLKALKKGKRDYDKTK